MYARSGPQRNFRRLETLMIQKDEFRNIVTTEEDEFNLVLKLIPTWIWSSTSFIDVSQCNFFWLEGKLVTPCWVRYCSFPFLPTNPSSQALQLTSNSPHTLLPELRRTEIQRHNLQVSHASLEASGPDANLDCVFVKTHNDH